MIERDGAHPKGYGSRRRFDSGFRTPHDHHYQRERRKGSRYQKKGLPTRRTLAEFIPNARHILERIVVCDKRSTLARERRAFAEERTAAGMEAVTLILKHLIPTPPAATDK